MILSLFAAVVGLTCFAETALEDDGLSLYICLTSSTKLRDVQVETQMIMN